MAAGLENELRLRLVELRIRYQENVAVIASLDRMSEARVNTEAVRLPRWHTLGLAPPPGFPFGASADRPTEAVVNNARTHLLDLQSAVDELRSELVFDSGCIKQEGRQIKLILHVALHCRAVGLPVEVSPRIARLIPNGYRTCTEITASQHSVDTSRFIFPDTRRG